MFDQIARFARRQMRSPGKRVASNFHAKDARRRMHDIDDDDMQIIERALPYTRVDAERLHAVIGATRYAIHANISGAIVECGVWKDGPNMTSMLTPKSLGLSDREFHPYDTFEGMNWPTEHDICHNGTPAIVDFEQRIPSLRRQQPGGGKVSA